MKNKLFVYGPTKLKGTVIISGSKNAALSIIFASLLSEKTIKLYNVPKIQDIKNTIKLLNYLGVKTKIKKYLYINASNINKFFAPNKLIKITRASFWYLGALLTRFGYVKIFYPGGCNIGARPIDIHIFGFKKLGAKIKIFKNYIIASTKNKLIGTKIKLKKKSVGATINIMIAATLAVGKTTIKNASCEPEVLETANFLKILGACIQGAGTSIIIIIGVNNLNGGQYTISADRIETGTFLLAAAVSSGNIVCYKTQPFFLKNILVKLKKIGADIKTGLNWISLNMHDKKPKAVNLTTAPYPGFPTDMQAQFTLLNMISKGKSIITENIFENRFMHVPELIKMGGIAKIIKNKIICKGTNKLFGAQVNATDLRTAVSLIIAGCIAHGITIINNINHVYRGYENIENKLISIGAKIKKI